MKDTMNKPRRPRRMAREPEVKSAQPARSVDAGGRAANSKAARVVEMLKMEEGASLDELVAATGWLPHTTRAAMTGLRKKGHLLTSEKVDGLRRYRITGAMV